MTSGGSRKEAAWEWLSFVNSVPQQEKYFAQTMKRASARKEVYQSAAWQGVVKAQPAVDGIETLVPETKEFPWVQWTPINTDTSTIWPKVQKNQLTVNDALGQLESIINRDLAAR